jgi:hypothetical protein
MVTAGKREMLIAGEREMLIAGEKKSKSATTCCEVTWRQNVEGQEPKASPHQNAGKYDHVGRDARNESERRQPRASWQQANVVVGLR